MNAELRCQECKVKIWGRRGIVMELKKTQLMRKATRKKPRHRTRERRDRGGTLSNATQTSFVDNLTGCSQHLTPSAKVKTFNNIEIHEPRIKKKTNPQKTHTYKTIFFKQKKNTLPKKSKIFLFSLQIRLNFLTVSCSPASD